MTGYYLSVKNPEAYEMLCCNGNLFHDESPGRGHVVVMRRIASRVAKTVAGGGARWGIWTPGGTGAVRTTTSARRSLMPQEDQPDDHVVVTGESRQPFRILSNRV